MVAERDHGLYSGRAIPAVAVPGCEMPAWPGEEEAVMTTDFTQSTTSATPPASALAVWSLVLGIVGLVFLGLLAGIPAIICGHMARSRIKASPAEVSGAGLALAGLIMGYLVTILSVLLIAFLVVLIFVGGEASAPFIYTLF
jgi:hypothetical protein